jgi:5-(carboxyamino)imidazole ribonucleotide synthase
MNSPLASGATIGIVGGGQLGRMLAMAAARLGFPDDRARAASRLPGRPGRQPHIAAAYDDVDALAELARRCDVVTYEFENVPIDAAASLARACSALSAARALEVSQDRLSEKTFLNGIGIATAGFRPVDGERRRARRSRPLVARAS